MSPSEKQREAPVGYAVFWELAAWLLVAASDSAKWHYFGTGGIAIARPGPTRYSWRVPTERGDRAMTLRGSLACPVGGWPSPAPVVRESGSPDPPKPRLLARVLNRGPAGVRSLTERMFAP